MITYVTTAGGVSADQLVGFFEGWPDPPSPERHLDVLRGSSHVVLAINDRQIIGFITAISDGILSAYIPLLEVRADHRGQGVGSQLVRLMLEQLQSYYMVDITCDPDLQAFYQRFALTPTVGAAIRNYALQSARHPSPVP